VLLDSFSSSYVHLESEMKVPYLTIGWGGKTTEGLELMSTHQYGRVLPGYNGEGVGYGAASLLPRHGVPLVQALAQPVGRAVGPLPVADPSVHRRYVTLTERNCLAH
jgi:hypothetical protein